MDMQVQTLDGSPVGLKGTKKGSVYVQDFGARYAEAVIAGSVFSASNVAAQAVSVALATTYTGLCLSNPVGSGKRAIILSASYAISVAEAAIATQHLIAGGSSTGVITHTTPLAAPGIQSALIGAAAGTTNSASSAMKVDSACTVVNPYYLASLRSGFTAGALGGGQSSEPSVHGMFVVDPGGWIAHGALTAITGFGSFVWMEVAI